jgi:diketogulonate reductase-like aldo/keto reductase
MAIPVKKLKSGFSLPVFGLGTWQMGGRDERDLANDDQADIKAIIEAINLGITHIDTAEIYADGYAEKLVGQAIRNFDHSKLFIVSKVKATHLNYQAALTAGKQSLKRIGIKYLDLLLMHQYPGDKFLAESVRAFDELVGLGLVRNIGVSNFTKEHLAAAQALTKNKIVCNQVHYNLRYREPEVTGLLKYCQDNDVLLVAWRPVGKGELVKNVPPVLKMICEKYKKTPAQVAINWLFSQPNVITLAKSRSLDHLKENLGAIGWQLSLEDIELLRREYPNQQPVSNIVPLA